MALRGANITDEEYVDTFGLDPKLAHTPELNEAMIDYAYNQNINAGIEEEKAKTYASRARATVKKLLAQNGYLK